MDHKEIELYLVEYSVDAVDDATHSIIENHVKACKSCSEQLQIIQYIRKVISTYGNVILEGHPPSEDLAIYCIDEIAQSAEEKSNIANHLMYCPTCSYEVEISRKAIVEADCHDCNLAAIEIKAAIA